MIRTRKRLPPEVESLVAAIIESVLALADLVAAGELEQRFEFAWGHQDNPC